MREEIQNSAFFAYLCVETVLTQRYAKNAESLGWQRQRAVWERLLAAPHLVPFRPGLHRLIDYFPHSGNTLERGGIACRHQFVGPTHLIPADVPDLRTNHQIRHL